MQTAPSSLSDIHSFLLAHQAAPPPWSSPRAQLDALLGLLHERSSDDAFWGELAGLLRRLEDRRVSPALVSGAEVLDGASLEEVLTALRGVVRAPKASWASGLRRLQPLAAFAVLGIALVGCGDAGKDSAGSADAACDDAEAQGLSGTEAEVYCELLDLIEGSEATYAAQNLLTDCLPSLSAGRRAELLESFESASDEDLAALIEQLAYASPCYEEEETFDSH